VETGKQEYVRPGLSSSPILLLTKTQCFRELQYHAGILIIKLSVSCLLVSYQAQKCTTFPVLLFSTAHLVFTLEMKTMLMPRPNSK
jgi:hypothetical protein